MRYHAVALAPGKPFILHAAENDRFDTNPKRKRGNVLQSSLALRVSVNTDRGQYSIPYFNSTDQ